MVTFNALNSWCVVNCARKSQANLLSEKQIHTTQGRVRRLTSSWFLSFRFLPISIQKITLKKIRFTSYAYTVWSSDFNTLLMRYGVKFTSFRIKSVYKSLDQTVQWVTKKYIAVLETCVFCVYLRNHLSYKKIINIYLHPCLKSF